MHGYYIGHMKRKRYMGFTLLELMFTIAIGAIVIGIGVPNLVNLVRNNRIAADTNDLVIGLHAGRSEAVKQRSTVVMCASGEYDQANPSCGTSFAQGWIVFVDRNANGEFDENADPELSDLVVEAHGPMRDGLLVSTENNYFALSPSGFGRDIAGMGGRLANILVCDERGNSDLGGGRSAARLIAVSATGRPQVLNSVAEVDARTGGCPL